MQNSIYNKLIQSDNHQIGGLFIISVSSIDQNPSFISIILLFLQYYNYLHCVLYNVLLYLVFNNKLFTMKLK